LEQKSFLMNVVGTENWCLYQHMLYFKYTFINLPEFIPLPR
jgi:hypothetical protein